MYRCWFYLCIYCMETAWNRPLETPLELPLEILGLSITYANVLRFGAPYELWPHVGPMHYLGETYTYLGGTHMRPCSYLSGPMWDPHTILGGTHVGPTILIELTWNSHIQWKQLSRTHDHVNRTSFKKLYIVVYIESINKIISMCKIII